MSNEVTAKVDVRQLNMMQEQKNLANELAAMSITEKATFLNLLIGFTLDAGDAELPIGYAFNVVRSAQKRMDKARAGEGV